MLKPNWIASARVVSFDKEKGTITLWFEGPIETQTVPIVSEMPDWLFREGVAINVKIPRECVTKRDLTDVVWGEFIHDTFMQELLDVWTEDEVYAELQRLYGAKRD